MHRSVCIFILYFVAGFGSLSAQTLPSGVQWIRPDNERSSPVWGIHGGIVVGLWPAVIEQGQPGNDGGPRGLLRIGYENRGIVYLINFIAVEPVVNNDMEFSEVSPSVVDGKWGKMMWAAGSPADSKFTSYAATRGTISHPDQQHPEVEELSLYVFMEQYLDGAHPYLKLSIRSDRPGELEMQIFNQEKSAKMERCALTATMGNYSRLRLLYLKNKVVDSRQLFSGYDDIGFIEKDPYPATDMLRTRAGDYFVVAESNESFKDLSSWPQEAAYAEKWGWRYRPFYKLTQYWRVAAADYDPSLHVRVNGRVKYWGAESADKKNYVDVPGGPAFENFELRQNYRQGQKFYFGLSTKAAIDLIPSF